MMVYYVRKISRAKWQEKPLSSDPCIAEREIGSVSADAITNCLKTTSNKLSLWRVDIESYTIEDIVPLIVGFEKPDTCDVVYIPEELLLETNLELQQSQDDAKIPIEKLKPTHYNIIVKDYSGLGAFSKIVLKSLQNYKRYRAPEIKSKLKDMIKSHVIEPEMLSSSLCKKLDIMQS